MTHLGDALQSLGLNSVETVLNGRWITIQGERCRVHIVEAAWGGKYYTWCEQPGDRTIEAFSDPYAAIRQGLRRAVNRHSGQSSTTGPPPP